MKTILVGTKTHSNGLKKRLTGNNERDFYGKHFAEMHEILCKQGNMLIPTYIKINLQRDYIYASIPAC